MGRGRILLVEDDVHARRIGSLALTAAGFEVHEALDGEEAVARAAALRPDLIVMDVMLPLLSGLEAAARIKRDLGPAAPVVLALTARAMREDVERAFAAGCDAYLCKPLDPADLVAEVERLLARRGEGA
jgi:two-component system cell cycle response regulator DivK